MLTTIYLVRHGKTIGGDEKRYKGHVDIPLSEDGEKQIQRLTEHLQGRILTESEQLSFVQENSVGVGSTSDGLDAAYCSDLLRAVKTAEILSEPFGIKPELVAQLRERSFGRWEGMNFDEIRSAFPEEFDAWANNPLQFSPVGGESTEDVKERIMPVFYEIVKKHKNQKVVIVGHGGINRIILCELLKIPLEYIFRIEQDFAGLNVILFYESTPVVKQINYTL